MFRILSNVNDKEMSGTCYKFLDDQTKLTDIFGAMSVGR